jgi:hypothetical protein
LHPNVIIEVIVSTVADAVATALTEILFVTYVVCLFSVKTKSGCNFATVYRTALKVVANACPMGLVFGIVLGSVRR